MSSSITPLSAPAPAPTIFGHPKWPPFVPDAPKYAQTTYVGRWLQFMDVIDPSVLFTTNAKLKESCALLAEYKAGGARDVGDRALWTAQKVKTSMVHPDTGETILPPFRMSGFVPFGFPTVVGLLLPNHTARSMIMWQWLNQTHNACVNYANRNASTPTPMYRFVLGYVGAVGSSVGIALALQKLIASTSNMSAATKFVFQRFVPLPAVSLASSCNVVLMRMPELDSGIAVFDSKNTKVGTSKAAARRALRDTTLTRAFLPVPIFVLPPVLMLTLERQSWFAAACKRHRHLHLGASAIACVVVFWAALPMTIAIFPQKSSIAIADVEPDIAAAAARTGELVLFYNKGL